MRRILSFFGLCAYTLGSIGGFSYCLYGRQYPISVCVLILAVMAFPTAKKLFKELTD